MHSKIRDRLVFACISAVVLSVALLAPYALADSQIWQNTNSKIIQSPVLNLDITEDEFTGDAIQMIEDANTFDNKYN